MAKVTWLGEGPEGPQEMTWGGETFKVGEAVETDDLNICRKAAGNKYFKVEGYELPAAKHPEEPLSYRPPSQQGAQHPVPKPGELIVPRGLIPPEPPPEIPPPEGDTTRRKPLIPPPPLHPRRS